MVRNLKTKSLILPDFIIAGAMKSGTTSLHYILDKHPHIFVANREIMFFDIDDPVQNLDFFLQISKNWCFFDYDRHFDEYLIWYSSFFKGSTKNQIIGEDSTTYMASQKAPKRIFNLLPEAKIIFMLRDPVARTYSHYWHLVHYGITIYDFEKTLQNMPGLLIQRSLYKEQIERFMNLFPFHNLKFIIFEDFVTDTQRNIDEVCAFVGAERNIDVSSISTHLNPTKTPRSIKLQIFYNHLFRSRRLVARQFASHLPGVSAVYTPKFWQKMDRLIGKLNFTDKKSYPPMKSSTKKFLQRLFKKENTGLSEIIQKNLNDFWPYMKE